MVTKIYLQQKKIKNLRNEHAFTFLYRRDVSFKNLLRMYKLYLSFIMIIDPIWPMGSSINFLGDIPQKIQFYFSLPAYAMQL